jgi:inorganic triphosphatase YgiF
VTAPARAGAARDHVEREVKLAVDPDLVLPHLDGLGSGVIAVGITSQRLDATYYDADDLRLLVRGVTVRRRTGEGTRWTVKQAAGWGAAPVAGALQRREVDVVDESPDPPAGVVDLLAADLAGAPLVAVARLVSDRHRIELRVPSGAVVAEIDDDLVSVFDDQTPVGRFREIEIELADTDDPTDPGAQVEAQVAQMVVAEVVDRLVAAGAVAGAGRPKVDRALDLLRRS